SSIRSGMPPTQLATMGRALVDLHGQHETQSLLLSTSQRDILDAFGNALEEREAVRRAFEEAERLRREELELLARRDDVVKRADYLRHVAREIADARLRKGEDEALEIEARRLGNVEEITRLAERLLELLEGGAVGEAESAGAVGAAGALGAAAKTLGQLERIDASVGRWRELIEAAQANVDELALVLSEYAADLDADPARLAEVERRRDLLYRLLQKYGPTIEDVLETGESARRELDLLDTADFDLEHLSECRREAEHELERAAEALSAKRKKAAGRLARDVQALMPGLGMPEGEFRVELGKAETVTAAGADTVRFMVQLNPGIPARPLAQVASGGELSRLMLALEVVLAQHDAVPTLVFDEVDQGIGGEVAAQVGEALSHVSRTRQVLVITHLPQIAARASHHVRVAKRARGGIATADVTALEGQRRVDELARMLGDAGDKTAVRHARELLKKGGG
ncbi:MAG: DNA repair protein RecN, partial [Gemmatimonadales bacterium]